MALAAVTSQVTKNPLHMLWGLGACFPVVQSQVPIGSEFLIANATDPFFSSNVLGNDNFLFTWGVDDIHNATGTNVFGNPILYTVNDVAVYAQIYDSCGRKVSALFKTTPQSTPTVPSAIVMNNGNIAVIWVTCNNPECFPFGACYGQIFDQTGSKIGMQFQVGANQTIVVTPDVFLLSNGNLLVGLTIFDGSIALYGVVYDPNGNQIWARAVQSTSPQEEVIAGAGNVNGLGTILTVLETEENNITNLYSQSFDENGTSISDRVQIASYAQPTVICNSTSIAKTVQVDHYINGNFMINWKTCFGSLSEAWIQNFDSNGLKIGEASLLASSVNSTICLGYSYFLGNDKSIQLWAFSTDSACTLLEGIYGQFYDPTGQKIGNGIQFTSNISEFVLGGFGLTSLSNGNFVLQLTEKTRAYARMYDSNATFINEFQANPPNAVNMTPKRYEILDLNNDTFVSVVQYNQTIGSTSYFVSLGQMYSLQPITANSSASLQRNCEASSESWQGPALITGITGLCLGAIAYGKVFIDQLTARNLKKAMADSKKVKHYHKVLSYKKSAGSEDQRVLFYRETVCLLAQPILEKCNSTNWVGFRSYNKAVSYLRSLQPLAKKLEELEGFSNVVQAQKDLLLKEVVDQVQKCIAPQDNSIVHACSKPTLTPEMLEENAGVIAAAINGYLEAH